MSQSSSEEDCHSESASKRVRMDSDSISEFVTTSDTDSSVVVISDSESENQDAETATNATGTEYEIQSSQSAKSQLATPDDIQEDSSGSDDDDENIPLQSSKPLNQIQKVIKESVYQIAKSLEIELWSGASLVLQKKFIFGIANFVLHVQCTPIKLNDEMHMFASKDFELCLAGKNNTFFPVCIQDNCFDLALTTVCGMSFCSDHSNFRPPFWAKFYLAIIVIRHQKEMGYSVGTLQGWNDFLDDMKNVPSIYLNLGGSSNYRLYINKKENLCFDYKFGYNRRFVTVCKNENCLSQTRCTVDQSENQDLSLCKKCKEKLPQL